MEPEHAAFPESKLPSIQIQIRVALPSQSPVTSLNGGGGEVVIFATTTDDRATSATLAQSSIEARKRPAQVSVLSTCSDQGHGIRPTRSSSSAEKETPETPKVGDCT